MKILIAIGMLIVFISVFFIFLTGDVISNQVMSCAVEDGQPVCTFLGFTGPAIFGIVIIGFFLIIDIFTVYLIVTNVE
jgi:hypothetical protein